MRIPRRGSAALFFATAAAAVTAASPSSARAQLRVVSLNTYNGEAEFPLPRSPWIDTVLRAIGSSISDDPFVAGNTGIAKPVDVLALQEVYSAQSTVAGFASIMNSLYPGSNYQYATLNGGSTGAGTQGLVYNANAVTLVSSATVGTSSGSGQPRQALRYRLRPVGYDSSADIYLYNSHYKAGNGDTDPNLPVRRNVEAMAVRADADALGANKNVIYLGDFNVYHDTEPMFQTLIAAGNGQAHDPINKIGDWHINPTYKAAHTQSPYSSATAASLGTGFTQGATGGMDDRFDYQLLTASMIDGDGVAYIPNSYQAFGNNSTHDPTNTMNKSINNSTNTAQPKNVLDSMAGVLDHVPVVADYQLPARLGVSVAAVPVRVIVGGNVSVDATVTNTAPVFYGIGADTLSYTLIASGALSGSTTGTDGALGTGNTHAITLSTASVGAKNGTISVTSISESVAGNNFTLPVSYTVLHHSDASFSASADVTRATIDFGYVPSGFAPRTSSFAVANRQWTFGTSLIAGLDIDGVVRTGSTRMSTDIVATDPAKPVAVGESLSYTATFTPDTVAGDNAAAHTIAVSDENIPGAAAGASLVLSTNGRTVTDGVFPLTGFMKLLVGETYHTAAFQIAAGVTLTLTGPGAMVIDGPQSSGAGAQLVINAGNTSFNTDAGGALGVIVNNAGAAVTFNATQHLASLHLAGGGNASLSPGGAKVLTTPDLSILGSSHLDLTNNTLIVPGGDVGSFNGSAYTGITGLVQSGRVRSSSADGLTTLGVGQSGADALVKFTYAGDATLDGKINVDDYGRIDFNIALGSSGWSNGDFNYDGKINVDDYGIIDFNIGAQGPPLFAGGQGAPVAVPEPIGFPILLAAIVLSPRQRRGRQAGTSK